MPIARRSVGSRPSFSSSPRAAFSTQPSTASGPSMTRMAAPSSAWIRPVRSLIAMRTCEAPTSTARTTRSLAVMANWDDGRPPVETASPTGPTSPSRMRASMRRATVERASPVIAESSVRVRGRPSRRIWNRSLVTDDPRALMCPSACETVTSVTNRSNHNDRQKGPRRAQLSRMPGGSGGAPGLSAGRAGSARHRPVEAGLPGRPATRRGEGVRARPARPWAAGNDALP